MQKKKVAHDRLSIDEEPKRHKWVKGEWEYISLYTERVDTCSVCGCQRHTISFTLHGKRFTEVSAYVRSGIHIPPKPAPECWGSHNPK